MRLFYSWQSDIPDNTKVIRKVLKKVCDELDIEYTEDTRSETGAEHIIDVLQRKISNSHIFVGDITITSKTPTHKPQINSNVAYELGYAEAKLTRSRLLLLYNNTYGNYEDIPFDLGKRMVTTFSSTEPKKLYSDLHRKLTAMKLVAVSATGSNLNKAEKSILYWSNKRGEDQIHTRHLSYNSVKVEVLCPGEGLPTRSFYAFYGLRQYREKAVYKRAMALLIDKGFLTPAEIINRPFRLTGENSWALTEEGEVMAQSINEAEVNGLSELKEDD